ncbi:AGAP011282-PA, partial [Anopheles gambiae str. PEST]
CCDRTAIPTMGKTEQPLIVRYKNQWYDLTEFAHKHPGGKNSLTGLHEKDMAERFDRAPGHSQAAKYLMKEYQIKHDPKQKQQNGHSLPNGTKATVNGATLRNGTKPTGNGLHSTKPHGEGHTTAYLVDWSKPMLLQIYRLGDKYAEWVNKPVDRELRLFGPTWVENLTRTPWWIVPAFWIPAILYLIVRHGAQQRERIVPHGRALPASSDRGVRVDAARVLAPPVGVPSRPEGQPGAADVPLSDPRPAPQGAVRSAPVSVSGTAGPAADQPVLPAGVLCIPLSAANACRWTDRLSRIRYDPLLSTLWQPSRGPSVSYEAIPLLPSLCPSRSSQIHHRIGRLAHRLHRRNLAPRRRIPVPLLSPTMLS